MTYQYGHYKETEELIAMLHATQLRNYGSSLQTAMDEGATGTEIFMALRWNLEKLLSEPSCPDLIRAKSKKLWKKLDKALVCSLIQD